MHCSECSKTASSTVHTHIQSLFSSLRRQFSLKYQISNLSIDNNYNNKKKKKNMSSSSSESENNGNSRNCNGNGSRVTWEGCSVLLDINDGDRLVFARLSPAASVLFFLLFFFFLLINQLINIIILLCV